MSQQRLESVKSGDHIFGIYNRKTELDEAFKFLKMGFDKNETVMLITEYLSKDEIRNRMGEQWQIEDVEKLESKGEIIIRTAEEWYFPEGVVDPDKIVRQWNKIVSSSLEIGKRALRVFADTSALFKNGLGEKMVNYEFTLGKKFDFPFIAICAYTHDDIETLTQKQFVKLCSHHESIWLEPKNVLEKLLSLEKNTQSEKGWITIKNPEFQKKILYSYSDKNKKCILNATIEAPKKISEILTECNLSQTSGYRKIKSLIGENLIIPTGITIIPDHNITKKYQSVFEHLNIDIAQGQVTIRVKLNPRLIGM